MTLPSGQLRVLFFAGTAVLFLAMAVGLYYSFDVDRRLPPVELADVVDTHLQDIEQLLEAGEYDRAIEQLELALRLLFRNRHLPHDMLGRALARQGRLDEAVDHFLRAIEIDPTFVVAHYNLGVAYEEQGHPDEAVAELREALRLAPDFQPAQSFLARIEAQLPASEPVESGDLGRGRAVVRQFYRGELELLHEQFSELFAANMSLDDFRQMHATLRRQLGPELEVVVERVDRSGETRLYVRRARFEKHGGDVEVLVQVEPDGSIGGILFRPVGPASEP